MIKKTKKTNEQRLWLKLMALFILLFSGWRLVDVYGNPKYTHDSNGTSIDYLITSGDGTIVDVGNYFKGYVSGWMLSGIDPRQYPSYRVVNMWKPLNWSKRCSFLALRKIKTKTNRVL